MADSYATQLDRVQTAIAAIESGTLQSCSVGSQRFFLLTPPHGVLTALPRKKPLAKEMAEAVHLRELEMLTQDVSHTRVTEGKTPSDESSAIGAALEAVYPEVLWQHCVFHRLALLRKDIGATAYRDLMLAEAACVFRCPSRQAALEAAGFWRQRWQPIDPVAVAHFLEELRDSLNFYDLPMNWWKRVRTNNPLERLIRTLRQRLRPMGCFHDEPAIERAVFGQLLRRHKIKLTHNT